MTPPASDPDRDDDPRPRLLIADDDAIVRVALCAQLERDFDVIAVAGDATTAIALAERHQPDLALVDVEMPNGGARAAVPEIARCSPNTGIVILSGDESRQVVLELLSAGAVAYLRKGASADAITRTLTEALLLSAER